MEYRITEEVPKKSENIAEVDDSPWKVKHNSARLSKNLSNITDKFGDDS